MSGPIVLACNTCGEHLPESGTHDEVYEAALAAGWEVDRETGDAVCKACLDRKRLSTVTCNRCGVYSEFSGASRAEVWENALLAGWDLYLSSAASLCRTCAVSRSNEVRMPLIAHTVLKPEQFNAEHLAFLVDRACNQRCIGQRLSTLDVMQKVLDDLVAEGVLGVA